MVGSLIRQGARCSLPITYGSLILPISMIQSILDSSLTHSYWYLVPVVLLALNTDEANSIAARPDLETVVPRSYHDVRRCLMYPFWFPQRLIPQDMNITGHYLLGTNSINAKHIETPLILITRHKLRIPNILLSPNKEVHSLP